METLWITLPNNEEREIKRVINLISSKNLTNLSLNQLIEKLENNQAADWLEILGRYNSIPSINNINTSEMLDRAKGVRNKFVQRAYPQLRDREFRPHELLSLVILCYSNPNLIGPKLCKALNDNNEAGIKEEMLENSARVGNRVAPWASNLRLLSTSLYFNDTTIQLPKSLIDRVTRETIRDGNIVIKLDQRGGFEEKINGTERAARVRRDGSEIDTYAILQSLQTSKYDSKHSSKVNIEEDFDYSAFQFDFPASTQGISHLNNGSELPPEEFLGLSATCNAAENVSLNNPLIVGGIALASVSHIPVLSVVRRNIAKDLTSLARFCHQKLFSDAKPAEQIDEPKPILKSTCN